MGTVLFVPGLDGSSPGHWQSIWEREHPEYRRVQQRDWDHPDPREWVATLDRAIRLAEGRVTLVGHSLGCITIARWAAESTVTSVVAAAMLVAPGDVEASTAPAEVRSFAPVPLRPLPFHCLIVASTNDPFLTPARARLFADSWGGRLVSIGDAGHIHTAAGYGPWPEGHSMLRELIASGKGGNRA